MDQVVALERRNHVLAHLVVTARGDSIECFRLEAKIRFVERRYIPALTRVVRSCAMKIRQDYVRPRTPTEVRPKLWGAVYDSYRKEVHHLHSGENGRLELFF